jgi:26S proteasome regulatory subunit N12
MVGTRRASTSSSTSVAHGKDLIKQIQAAIATNDHATALERLDDFKVHAATTFVGNEEDELRLRREAAEHGVMISAATRDEESFERHASQAKAAYDACKRAPCKQPIERSQNEALIVGLNLLRLLVQNRIAEFHAELETTDDDVLKDQRVQAVLELEQFLMEGACNKIAQRQNALPDPSYEYFMSMLMNTVRDEIASCAESAYGSLTGAEAMKLLGFANAQEFEKYANARDWTMDANGGVVFNEEVAPASARDIPAAALINQTLLYAKELERIV